MIQRLLLPTVREADGREDRGDAVLILFICSCCGIQLESDEPLARCHEWADIMAKTHKQTKCPHCGLYMVWVPSKKRVKR
jgi:hypothetical protein